MCIAFELEWVEGAQKQADLVLSGETALGGIHNTWICTASNHDIPGLGIVCSFPGLAALPHMVESSLLNDAFFLIQLLHICKHTVVGCLPTEGGSFSNPLVHPFLYSLNLLGLLLVIGHFPSPTQLLETSPSSESNTNWLTYPLFPAKIAAHPSTKHAPQYVLALLLIKTRAFFESILLPTPASHASHILLFMNSSGYLYFQARAALAMFTNGHDEQAGSDSMRQNGACAALPSFSLP